MFRKQLINRFSAHANVIKRIEEKRPKESAKEYSGHADFIAKKPRKNIKKKVKSFLPFDEWNFRHEFRDLKLTQMDMLTVFYLCLMALCTYADADKQLNKQGRGRGSIWWWVLLFRRRISLVLTEWMQIAALNCFMEISSLMLTTWKSITSDANSFEPQAPLDLCK